MVQADHTGGLSGDAYEEILDLASEILRFDDAVKVTNRRLQTRCTKLVNLLESHGFSLGEQVEFPTLGVSVSITQSNSSRLSREALLAQDVPYGVVQKATVKSTSKPFVSFKKIS